MPAVRRLADGRRLHMHHGPMDLIVHVDGEPDAVAHAEQAAVDRFAGILDELVPQLTTLRAPLDPQQPPEVTGGVARRMLEATRSLDGTWATLMVAVAGSVADEICDLIAAVPGVRSAYVNNGGDVSLHVTPGSSLRVGLVGDMARGRADRVLVVDAESGIGGVATSGAGGRSHSLGIADAVTVVATGSAVADAAASIIANAVDLPGHPGITRVPARQVAPDSDLGEQLVTVEVGPLPPASVSDALGRGVAEAERRLASNPALFGAVLRLRGQVEVVGDHLAGRVQEISPVGPPERPGVSHEAI